MLKITNKCSHRDYLRGEKGKKKKNQEEKITARRKDNVTSFPSLRPLEEFAKKGPPPASWLENAMILPQTSSTPSVLPDDIVFDIGDGNGTVEAAVNTAGGCQKIPTEVVESTTTSKGPLLPHQEQPVAAAAVGLA